MLSSACGIQALGLLIRVGPLCVCTRLLVVDKRVARGALMHMCGSTFAQVYATAASLGCWPLTNRSAFG